MDYEKKYKEALERFKTFREKYCTYGELHFGDVIFDKTGEAQKDLDAIFPELAESEDERIRKEINTLYSDIDTCISELLKARTDKDSETEGKALFKMEGLMVATLQDLSCIEDYLEKQKEQKKDNPLEDFSRGYNAGYYHGITDSEQKPAQTETEKQYVRTLKALVSDFIRDRNPEDVPYYQGIFDWLDGRHIERQPAEWSEEDSRMLSDIVGYITGTGSSSGITKQERADFLYGLSKRFNLQPKQELDEDTAQWVECIIKDYEQKLVEEPNHAATIQAKITVLKSLRPSKDCSSCAKNLEGYISGRIDAENKLLEQFGALITPEGELHIKPRWKPSEDEERLINTSISFLKDFADKGYENAVECIDWLKSKLNGNTCKQNESGSESHYPEHA